MPTLHQEAAGRIRYRISFVANPRHSAGRAGLFSEELNAEIRRSNTPESRTVYFDGRHARIEEINTDYGVRSGSVELRNAGDGTITYCKKFPRFGFCLEHPILIPPGGPPPHLEPTDETTTIAGFSCRKWEYQGDRHLFVWTTDEITVNDPTGAVLRLEGVPGLILQTEEIPDSDAVDAVRRTTVVELSFDPPSPELFTAPTDYRRFDTIDAVRAEDRRMIDAEAQAHPPDEETGNKFVGRWLFEREKDRIIVEIVRAGEHEFQFRTTVETASDDIAGRVSNEKASMQGDMLMVEEPPNYRRYRLGNGGGSLIQIDNELFTFVRY